MNLRLVRFRLGNRYRRLRTRRNQPSPGNLTTFTTTASFINAFRDWSSRNRHLLEELQRPIHLYQPRTPAEGQPRSETASTSFASCNLLPTSRTNPNADRPRPTLQLMPEATHTPSSNQDVVHTPGSHIRPSFTWHPPVSSPLTHLSASTSATPPVTTAAAASAFPGPLINHGFVSAPSTRPRRPTTPMSVLEPHRAQLPLAGAPSTHVGLGRGDDNQPGIAARDRVHQLPHFNWATEDNQNENVSTGK